MPISRATCGACATQRMPKPTEATNLSVASSTRTARTCPGVSRKGSKTSDIPARCADKGLELRNEWRLSCLRCRHSRRACGPPPWCRSCSYRRHGRGAGRRWGREELEHLGEAAGGEVVVAADARGELRGKVGDGVNQAADLISATASIPSLNFIPLPTFGNWF